MAKRKNFTVIYYGEKISFVLLVLRFFPYIDILMDKIELLQYATPYCYVSFPCIDILMNKIELLWYTTSYYNTLQHVTHSAWDTTQFNTLLGNEDGTRCCRRVCHSDCVLQACVSQWLCVASCGVSKWVVFRHATSCSVFNTLQHTATRNILSRLQHTAAHCNTLQHIATHCNTLQHTIPYCNTLQHATSCFVFSSHKQTLVNSITGNLPNWRDCVATVNLIATAAHTPSWQEGGLCCTRALQKKKGCNTLQHTSVLHCNTLLHTTSVCSV